jgi:hypothetical protein
MDTSCALLLTDMHRRRIGRRDDEGVGAGGIASARDRDGYVSLRFLYPRPR